MPCRCKKGQGVPHQSLSRKRGRRWQDYTATQRVAFGVLAFAEIALAAAAWRDLARRDRTEVRGRKWVWAMIIAINIIGPLSYFRWGRLPTAEEDDLRSPPAEGASETAAKAS
jgi:hypothetical protein